MSGLVALEVQHHTEATGNLQPAFAIPHALRPRTREMGSLMADARMGARPPKEGWFEDSGSKLPHSMRYRALHGRVRQPTVHG